MSQFARRLIYSVPLLILLALLAVENLAPVPYVFDKGVGQVSMLYFKMFRSDSLRYSKAMIATSEGLEELSLGTPDGRSDAAVKFRAAAELLREVHRAWAFDRVGKGLNGDEFDQFKADLPAAASLLEKGAATPETPELNRIAKYVKDARALLPNGAIL